MSGDINQNVEISVLLDFYGTLLSERRLEIMTLYYNDDLSLTEIAELTGITRQGVLDSIKKGVAELYSYEERLSFSKRYKKQKEQTDAIASLLRCIRGATEADTRSIAEAAERIQQLNL